MGMRKLLRMYLKQRVAQLGWSAEMKRKPGAGGGESSNGELRIPGCEGGTSFERQWGAIVKF